MAEEEKVEERDVTGEEIKAGVKLKTGHKVILIVGGHGHGTGGDPDAPGEPDNPQEPDAPHDGPGQPDSPGTPDAPGTPGAPGAPGKPDVPDAPPEPDKPPPPPTPHDALDVQIVSAAGAPQKALEFEIALPDGSKRAGRTDDAGKLHLDDLPPQAECSLTLPDVTSAQGGGQAAAGHIAYQPGMRLQAGTNSVVELPPRVRRGQLTGMHFETAKTFLLPSAMPGIRQLRALYESFGADLAVLVSGHTDTVGAGDYNRGLSNERADSIARFLTDDVDGWMKFYAGQSHSDPWGVREDQYMLSTLGQPVGVDGKLGTQTQAAYKAFQGAKGLPATGLPNKDTRRALVTDYMAQDGTSLPKAAKLANHGCGFSHLAVPTPPNTPEPKNRRVEIYLFEGEVMPAPQAKCPAGGCAEYPQWVAKTESTVDLDLPPGTASIQVFDGAGAPLPDAQVHLSGVLTLDGKTGADGVAAFDGVVPGKYTAIADKEGFSAADAEVEVASGQTASATLTLQPVVRTLRVLVQDDSKPARPVPGAQVSIDVPGAAAKATGGDGIASFDNLKPGKVHVKAAFKGQAKEADVELLQTSKAKSAPQVGTKLGVGPDKGPLGDVFDAVDSVFEFIVTFKLTLSENTIDPAARETGQFDVTLDFDDGSKEQLKIPTGQEQRFEKPDANNFTVSDVHGPTPHVNPSAQYLVTNHGGALTRTFPFRAEVATRLRLSLFDFNASFTTGLTPDGKDFVFNKALLDKFQAARIDDYTLVNTIAFDAKNPSTPRWFGFAPNGQPEPLKSLYLKKLADELHGRGIQLCVGYAIVDHQKTSSQDGKDLAAFLANKNSDIAAHAKGIVDFFKQRTIGKDAGGNDIKADIPIDGISFDFELNSFGAPQADGLAKLYLETAKAFQPTNGIVSYDNAPFKRDGKDLHAFMNIQPYKLAATAKNLVARPMCYTETTASSFDDVKASIACALDKGADGGGLHPSQLQMGIFANKVDALKKDEMKRWCDELFRANKVGVVLFMGQGLSSSFLDRAVEWEKALNPKQPAPGKVAGTPLQVPTLKPVQ